MTNLVVSGVPRSQSPTGNALSKSPPSKFTPEAHEEHLQRSLAGNEILKLPYGLQLPSAQYED